MFYLKKLQAFFFICILFFVFSCKFNKAGLRLFGIMPIQDVNKRIILSNTSGLFTNEFGRTASFTVKLSLPPDSTVKIGPISSLDPNEGIVISETMMTFTPENYDIEQTVTIQGVSDGIPDGNKSYFISLGTVQTLDYSYSLLTIPQVGVINTDKETASIAASPTLGLSTNESGSTAVFYVVLSTQPGDDVTIPSFTSNLPSECSLSGSITFTSSNWNIPQAVTVTGVDDNFIDGNKSCLINSMGAISGDKVYENKTIPTVTVINVDNDTAGFSFIPLTAATTTESGGQAQFAIVMNTIPIGSVSITGIVSSDTTEGTVSPSSVTFNSSNWNIQQIITVNGVDDFMEDGNIDYTIVFPNASAPHPSDISYNGLPPGSPGSFTNLDNDIRGVTIVPLAPTPSISPITVTEGGASQTFQVRLTSVPCSTPSTPANCTPSNVTINFTNNDVSQYTVSPISLTFTPADWNTYQTVTVTAVDDDVDDDDLDLTLIVNSISSTTDYNGVDPSDISIKVIDNDTAGFTINPAGGITVNENDPGGVGLESTITVVLNSQPTSNVTIGPIISTNLSEVIVAPTLGGGNTSIGNRTLVFTPTKDQAIINSDSDLDGLNDTSTGGWNVPQTIRVRAVVDGTLDGTSTQLIQFSSRTTADAKYANTTLTPTPDVPATNVDSGTPTIILQNISAVSFTENGTATITFQIVLATLPISNVTISNIVSSDTTEGVLLQNGSTATTASRNLVFTTTTNQAVTGTTTTTGGWNMPQTVTVRSVNDDFQDGNISFKITIPQATGSIEYNTLRAQSTNPAYNSTTGELTLTSIDTDTRGFIFNTTAITNPTTPLSVAEGASNTFTLKLSSDPCNTPGNPATCASGSVTVNLTNNNTAQYSISPSSLTFSAGTWNTPQTVTVTPINDNYDEDNMDFTLVLEPVSGSGTDYDGLNPADVYVRVIDNDTKNIVLSLATGFSDVTSSSGGYTQYNLSLGSQPAPGRTVTVTASVPTDAPQEGKILASDMTTELDTRNFTFDSTNWSTLQSFRVKGITGSGTGNTNFTLSFSATETGTLPAHLSTNYVSYTGSTASRTITNYHIGTGKKIRLAGGTTTLTESSITPIYFYVLLQQAPIADVTINFGIDTSFPCTLPATVDSTKQFTVTPASIVMNSTNWNQLINSNRVQVVSVNDAVDDGDISCPLRITSISTTDPYYSGLTVADFNEPSITVIDNDTLGIVKQSIMPNSGGNLLTSSSGAQGSLQYYLNSRPMTDVVLSFSGTGGRGTYSVPSITFTPSNYSSPQTLTITGSSIGATTDETYSSVATASSTETSTGAPNSAIYNAASISQNVKNVYNLYDLVPCTGPLIANCSSANSDGGTVAGTYSTTEIGGQAFFAIRLRARPSGTVSFTVSSSNPAEGTVSTSSISFNNGNWNSFQIITITGVDDLILDGNIPYTIDFGAMTGDSAFTITIPSLNVTNIDNE
jgi:hypothetical protein